MNGQCLATAHQALKNIRPTKNFLKRPRIETENEQEQEDRISKLPDCVLLNILSYLSSEEAVKTSLIRPFGNLWASLQTYEFDGRSVHHFSSPHLNWFRNLVDLVVKKHEAPRVFKVSFKFGCFMYFFPKTVDYPERKLLNQQEHSDKIDSWISFAVNKNVKVLDVEIHAHVYSKVRFDYDLPTKVLSSDSIEELVLINVGLGEPRQVVMKSLKVLSIATVMLTDEMIVKILTGCPLLESFSIIKCFGFENVNVTSRNLKFLMVDVGEFEWEEAVKISGPYLLSLHVAGAQGTFQLGNVSSLVEATLDLCSERSYDYSNVGELLGKLLHVKHYTMTSWCILVLAFYEYNGVSFPFFNHKHVVLKTTLTQFHLPGIICVLKNSKKLETFTIHIDAEATSKALDLQVGIPGHYEEDFNNNILWVAKHGFNGERYLKLRKSKGCLRNHLKTAKVLGDTSGQYVLPLLEYLLRCSKVLEDMVVSSPFEGQSKEQGGFSQMLFSFPKTSDRAMVRFC